LEITASFYFNFLTVKYLEKTITKIQKITPNFLFYQNPIFEKMYQKLLTGLYNKYLLPQNKAIQRFFGDGRRQRKLAIN